MNQELREFQSGNTKKGTSYILPVPSCILRIISRNSIRYTPEEIIGTSVFDYLDPQDVDRVREAFNEKTCKKSAI
jgi:hypothetical protein